MADIKFTVHYDDESCRVFLWEGVSPGDGAEPVECRNFTPVSVQVEGEWAMGGKVSIEGSCGGGFVHDTSFVMDGVKPLPKDYLYVKPKVSGMVGMKANVYLLGRR